MGGLGLGGWRDRSARRSPAPTRCGSTRCSKRPVALTAAATPRCSAGPAASTSRWGAPSCWATPAERRCGWSWPGLVLLPPTFLAGGTLGAAARAVEHEGDHRRRATALLYGVNTLGAVAGCLAATFWLLETFGTRIDAVGGRRREPPGRRAGGGRGAAGREAMPRDVGAERVPDAAASARGRPAAFVLAAAAVVGFAFFLMELVWYRMLGPILGGTVYTFGLVLAVALAGIAAGRPLVRAAFARRRGRPSRLRRHLPARGGVLIALPYVARRPPRAARARACGPPAGAGLWGTSRAGRS